MLKQVPSSRSVPGKSLIGSHDWAKRREEQRENRRRGKGSFFNMARLKVTL
jgi:hypothetical protein